MAVGELVRDAEFTEFARARAPWLRKVAYLLCGDWHRADDLVQASMLKLYTGWHRAGQVENVDGYARRTLINVFLAEQRGPWWQRVINHEREPDPEVLADARSVTALDLDAALDLRAALAALPPKQRAAVVLRYYCDLSVDQTAEILQCSTGNVKSQTWHGLRTLRVRLESGTADTTKGRGL
ncbi:SigE family RNA polymerase sigma factor [Catenulispora pinisilvae]|uniref:SigE family RNA polymerase sigma factor n=1 Tax=Catenulispora pinisilvae TaxID=2705253 RepID=UPI00189191DF|nr:SigE family RNA polymerase sigma factor [Catenulispora pinisilvae]